MGLTLGKAGMVSRWPALFQQLLLDQTPGPGGQGETTLVITVADQVLDFLSAGYLCLNGGGLTGDVELVVLAGDLDLAIATNRVGNFFRNTRGQRKLGELLQGPEDFF